MGDIAMGSVQFTVQAICQLHDLQFVKKFDANAVYFYCKCNIFSVRLKDCGKYSEYHNF